MVMPHFANTMPLMRIPLWLKLSWTVWVLVWAPIYWWQYGLQNFLFFCDLGNILIAVALWTESSLIFSWQACELLLFQSLFTVDLVLAVVTGPHFIGGTEYMFDQHIALWIRLLGLFHVLTPQLLLWFTSRHTGFCYGSRKCGRRESRIACRMSLMAHRSLRAPFEPPW